MSENAAWEWRVEDPTEFDTLGAREVHGLYARGELVSLIALSDPDEFDDSDTAPSYHYYMVMTTEREGFNGYENLDSFDTLADAKSYGETMRNEIMAMLLEEQDD